jgi:hypothetical protein
MNPKILLCLAFVLSAGLLGCSTTAHHAAATVGSSQIQKEVETLPDLKTVLKSIESGVPELAYVGLTEEKSHVTGYYALASQRPVSAPENYDHPRALTGNDVRVYIRIYPYDSEDAARSGVESMLMRFSRGPHQPQVVNGLMVYTWSSTPSPMNCGAFCRVGVYVVEVESGGQSGPPLVMKTLRALAQELGTSFKR